MNAPRALHIVNFLLWLVQFGVWAAYARNTFMAASALAGAVVSLYLADRANT